MCALAGVNAKFLRVLTFDRSFFKEDNREEDINNSWWCWCNVSAENYYLFQWLFAVIGVLEM